MYRLSAATLAAVSLFSVSAHSHASLVQSKAAAGSPYLAAIGISHGCDGSPTTRVEVSLPAGSTQVRAIARPGWRSEAAPDGSRVTWTGSLPAKETAFFMVSLRLPEAPAGTVLAFPTVQTCEKGEARWVELPAGTARPASPAPLLTVVAPGEAPARAGALTVAEPFARATAGKVGGAFATLLNAGEADRLLSASSPAAGTVELHETVRSGDVMRMQPVGALDIPAGGVVRLAPGGYHLMLVGLKAPLRRGDQVPVTLVFERGGSVTVPVPVSDPGAGGGGGHDHH
jgi:copper(I)-binding protein